MTACHFAPKSLHSDARRKVGSHISHFNTKDACAPDSNRM